MPTDGNDSVTSAVCLTAATPPPATKNGSSRAAVVGMTTRTLFDQIATRPPSFDRLNKGKVEMGGMVAKMSTTVVRSMRSLFGYGALRDGTNVPSSSRPTTRVNRKSTERVGDRGVRSMLNAETPPATLAVRSCARESGHAHNGNRAREQTFVDAIPE